MKKYETAISAGAFRIMEVDRALYSISLPLQKGMRKIIHDIFFGRISSLKNKGEWSSFRENHSPHRENDLKLSIDLPGGLSHSPPHPRQGQDSQSQQRQSAGLGNRGGSADLRAADG
jgi:hypothetical protein